MPIGPLDFKVIVFPGTDVSGEILSELEHLQKQGIIRVIDLVFITKDAAGVLETVKVSELKAEAADRYGWLIGDLLDVLTAEDIARVVSEIPPQGSAALLLFEHQWAVRLQGALQRADGTVSLQARLAAEKLEAVAAALTQAE